MGDSDHCRSCKTRLESSSLVLTRYGNGMKNLTGRLCIKAPQNIHKSIQFQNHDFQDSRTNHPRQQSNNLGLESRGLPRPLLDSTSFYISSREQHIWGVDFPGPSPDSALAHTPQAYQERLAPPAADKQAYWRRRHATGLTTSEQGPTKITLRRRNLTCRAWPCPRSTSTPPPPRRRSGSQ